MDNNIKKKKILSPEEKENRRIQFRDIDKYEEIEKLKVFLKNNTRQNEKEIDNIIDFYELKHRPTIIGNTLLPPNIPNKKVSICERIKNLALEKQYTITVDNIDKCILIFSLITILLIGLLFLYRFVHSIDTQFINKDGSINKSYKQSHTKVNYIRYLFSFIGFGLLVIQLWRRSAIPIKIVKLTDSQIKEMKKKKEQDKLNLCKDKNICNI